MDRERITQLVSLLKSSTSMELAVREGDSYIRVARAPVAAPAQMSAPAGAIAGAEAAAPAGDSVVSARLVGRFYRGKGPGQPPLVSSGDRVESGQIIATIEALGKLTGVPSPHAGDVVEVVAEDGQAVQYGAVLMRLRSG